MDTKFQLFLLLLISAACSKGGHGLSKVDPATQMFFGECRLEVHSKTPHAEIIVDGVEVGHDAVSLEVPCGEKRLYVRRNGFVPYIDYIPVNLGQAVRVNVELVPSKEIPNEALSAGLIDNLKASLIASNDSSGAGTAGAGSSADSVSSPEEDSVENWR